jgi:hypothetical protein
MRLNSLMVILSYSQTCLKDSLRPYCSIGRERRRSPACVVTMHIPTHSAMFNVPDMSRLIDTHRKHLVDS